MNNVTSTFHNDLSYKPHIHLGCLVERGYILLQIKPEFILGDINLK